MKEAAKAGKALAPLLTHQMESLKKERENDKELQDFLKIVND